MKKKLLIPFLLFAIAIHAQLSLKGRVVDEFNNPIPFVNVFFKNTTKGTTTNNNGNFSLKTTQREAILEISFIGFKTQSLKVNNKTSYLNITLKEDSNELEEVVIVSKPKKRLKKKENPAYRILKEIWKRKQKKGTDLVDYYQYQKRTTTEIGLNNLDSTFLKKIFKKQYIEIKNSVKYDSDGTNYYIPIYLQEQVKNIFGDNKNNKVRENIEAEKSDGLGADGFVFNRIATTFQNVDIFQNNINLLDRNFVSPISTDGFATYDYLIYDSIVKNDKKLYNIYFFPIRNNDLAFQGNFWVTDKTFAIQKLKMKVHKSINLNFVRGLTFEKEFEVKNDSIYLPTKNAYEGDFTLVDNSQNNKGLTVKKNIVLSKYIFNKPLSKTFYEQEIKQTRPNQYKKNKKYWDTKKDTETAFTYKLIQEVKEKQQIKNITRVINILTTGYIKTNSAIQFGSIWSILGNNKIEGYRAKFGFRTFKTKDDRYRIKTYMSYGFKDKKIKYGLEGRYLLSYKPRISVGAVYQKDIQQLGGVLLNTTELLSKGFSTSGLFSRGDNSFLSRIEKIGTNFDYQIKKNLHFGINFSHTKTQSASTEDFSINYLDDNKNIQSQVTDVASDIYLSYTPGRFEYGLGVQRQFGGDVYSTITLNFRRGYKGFFNGSHTYEKLQLKYNQPILLSKFGLFNATIEAGKTFGTVPLTLLNIVSANQSFSLVKNTFALLNYYDFVTDAYLAGHFEHHFNGFIFNRIPLLKKLKLRSLITFRATYGTISDKNIAINRSNINYNAPNKVYYEYGFGIKNIGYGNLRFLRIDAIWRSNYTPPLQSTATPTPKFAVRIKFRPSL